MSATRSLIELTSTPSSYAICIRLMVLTLTLPIDNAVPPIELMNASSLDVSLSNLQQLLNVLTLSEIKKLLSFHKQL